MNPPPMEPCGMIMDHLRSCYQTKMVFTEGGPAIPIRWYFASPCAKRFKGYNRFASHVWGSDRKRPWPGVGEIKTKVVYDLGANVNGKTGQQQCGPVEWYAEGVPQGATAQPCHCDEIHGPLPVFLCTQEGCPILNEQDQTALQPEG